METEAVISAIMAAFDTDDLATVKTWLSDPEFSKKLAGYDISKMKQQAFLKLGKLTKSETYQNKSIIGEFSEKV